jgi:DNA-binding transcriptional MerR regulator
MRIGELAASCGCPTETVRYYEKVGLLPSAARQQNGYRIYDASHRNWLQFILRSKDLGFSQSDVRRLTNLAQSKDSACSDVHNMLTEHVASVRAKLRELKRMERALVRLKDRCQDGTLHACPVIDELMT